AGGDPRDVTAEIVRGLRPFVEDADLHRTDRADQRPAESETVTLQRAEPETVTAETAPPVDPAEPETTRWRPDGDDATQVIRSDDEDDDYRRRLRDQAAAERTVRERRRQQREGGK